MGEGCDEEFLPEHTISMRKAFAYCMDLYCSRKDELVEGNQIFGIHSEANDRLKSDAKISATTICKQRQNALQDFWKQQPQQSFMGTTLPEDALHLRLEVLDLGSSQSQGFTPLEFRKHYQAGNVPCVIRGLDKTHFREVCRQWRRPTPTADVSTANTDNADKGTNFHVNRQWFCEYLGCDAKVPVRFQPSTSCCSDLDDSGRVLECETKEMILKDWIALLDRCQENKGDSVHYDCSANDYYLKDWHLQSTFRKQQGTLSLSFPQYSGFDIQCPKDALYQVPHHFEYDLLNAFLTKFTEKGDYMFTYWGPKGSRTTLHSDVLNSFSWSFNVAGTKEWKFFPPKPNHSHGQNDNPLMEHLVVTQRAGECMFVACGWQHEVVNLEETLSINHNWITTSNLDQVWSCIRSEMRDVEVEMEAWGMGPDCWDAKETMLRGCVGLDVTGFFFVILSRLLELLLVWTEHRSWAEDEIWQYHFDLVRLQCGLQALVESEEKVQVEDRLGAVLQSKASARTATEIAEWSMAKVIELHRAS